MLSFTKDIQCCLSIVHRVREAIAAGIIMFHILSGDDNPADILSKQWGYTQIKERIKALLFWKGDTADSKEGEATFQAKGEYQVFSASSRGIPGVSRTPFHRNQPERQDMPFETCLRQGNYCSTRHAF
jgi:hypothetical protein